MTKLHNILEKDSLIPVDDTSLKALAQKLLLLGTVFQAIRMNLDS